MNRGINGKEDIITSKGIIGDVVNVMDHMCESCFRVNGGRKSLMHIIKQVDLKRKIFKS